MPITEAKLKEETIFIPLTRNCNGANFLKFNKMRKYAFPFDWTFSPYSGILNALQDEFKDWFNNDLLEYGTPHFHKYKTMKGTEIKEVVPVVNTKYRISFLHEYLHGVHSGSKFADNQQRRVERFLKLLNGKTHLTFLIACGEQGEHAQRKMKNSGLEEYTKYDIHMKTSNTSFKKKLNKILTTKYPSLDFTIVTKKQFKKSYSKAFKD